MLSIDDYLPVQGESQEKKLALIREIDRSLTGISAPLPKTRVITTPNEQEALRAAFAAVVKNVAAAMTPLSFERAFRCLILP